MISLQVTMPSEPSSREPVSAPKVEDTIRQALDQYFQVLGDQQPHALYDMVISAAERPLLAYVMERYQGNLSHAAQALGITRFTLRTKLRGHGLIPSPKERSAP
jgi:Fis family transcriptional regulator